MGDGYEPFDPFAEDFDSATDDADQFLKAKGWQNGIPVGVENADMRMQAWTRVGADGKSEYMVEVVDNGIGITYVKTDGFVSTMDLMARWTPVVQASNISNVLHDLWSSRLSEYGLVEAIAARAAHGVEVTMPKMQGQEAALRRAAERRAAKRAGN